MSREDALALLQKQPGDPAKKWLSGQRIRQFGEAVYDDMTLAVGHYDVRDFGATGNGTDDTDAFNAALAAQQESNATLYIPAGRYKITAPLDLTAGGYSIRGDGAASEIVQHGVGVPVIRLGGYGNRIVNLGLAQNAMPTSTGDEYRLGESGIEIDALYLSVLEGIRISHVSYGLCLPNDRARFCFSNTFRDFDILNTYGGAISIVHHPSSGSTGNVWQNIYCNGSYLETHDWPVKIQGVHDSYFNQLNIEGFTGGGLLLLQQAGAVFNSLHFESNTLTGYYPSMLRLYDAANATVMAMTVQANQLAGGDASGVTRLASIGTDNCTLMVQGLRGLSNANGNALPGFLVDVEPTDCTEVEVHVDGVTFYGSGFEPQGANGSRGVWSLASKPTAHHGRLYQGFVTQSLTRYADTQVDLTEVSPNTTGWFVETDGATSTITVHETGKYVVDAGAKLRDLVDGETNLMVMVNGSVACQNGGQLIGRSRPNLSTTLNLEDGDVVSLSVYTESSGTPVVFESVSQDTWLAVTYVGP